jgi:hypothetical protein
VGQIVKRGRGRDGKPFHEVDFVQSLKGERPHRVRVAPGLCGGRSYERGERPVIFAWRRAWLDALRLGRWGATMMPQSDIFDPTVSAALKRANMP